MAQEAPINVLTDIPAAKAADVQPRSRGSVRVSVKATERGTSLDGFRQSGSLKLLFPRTPSFALEAVLVNTSGGVTGGDEVSVQATALNGTHLTITTQAAERAYQAQPGETGRISNRLTVEDHARLDWLPQETILFNNCSVRRSLTVDLARTAQLLLVEPMIYGRAAMGETLTQAMFHDRVEICRDGALIYLDAIRWDGDVARQLAHSAIGAGAGAMTSLIYVTSDAEAQLDPLRAMLPPMGGVSLIGSDLLVLRLLAPSGFELRKTLIPILNHLTNNTLPRPWMI